MNFKLDAQDVEWFASFIVRAIKAGNTELAYRITRLLVRYTR